MSFHINPETGEPGECYANIKCPFGDLEQDHYSTLHQARKHFEQSQHHLLFRSRSKITYLNEAKEKALDIAMSMEEDPDWLPPIDDPAKPDGIPEEEGYIKSLEAFRDPLLSMGNCSIVSDAVSEFTGGELEVVEEEVDGPYLNIHVANKYTNNDGDEMVIDYTYSQIDPNADWPHVAPLKEWQAKVRESGFTPSSIIKAEYEKHRSNDV